VAACTRENPGFTGPDSASASGSGTTGETTGDTVVSSQTDTNGSSGNQTTTESPTTEDPSTVDPPTTEDPTEPTSESESTTDELTSEDPTVDTEGETDGDSDADDDGVEDDCDPFPENPLRPGAIAESGTLYLVADNGLHHVLIANPSEEDGPVAFVDDDSEAVLHFSELAINECGVLFAANSSSVYVCNPINARCWVIVSGLNREPQGLSFARGDIIGMPGEVPLIGAHTNEWYGMDLSSDPYSEGTAYDFNPGLRVSGDLAWMVDVGLLAMVNPGDNYGNKDSIVRLNPDGSDDVLLADIPFHVRLRGIAAIGNNLYAVNNNGKILEFAYENQVFEVTALNFYTIGGNADFYGAASRPSG